DIWSAGVILLSILSRLYPFFNSADDTDQYHEIALLRGSRALRAAGLEVLRKVEMDNQHESVLDDSFHVPEEARPLEETCVASEHAIPPGEVRSFLLKLTDQCLDVNPRTRITARAAFDALHLLRAKFCPAADDGGDAASAADTLAASVAVGPQPDDSSLRAD
ncbi:hypothetical protein T492DRAFT_877351, partial [Pavlovales sp. CCMP2436]